MEHNVEQNTEQNQEVIEKPKKKKKWIMITAISAGTLIVALGILLYILPTFIMPQVYLSKGKSAFEKGEYAKAVENYEKSDNLSKDAEAKKNNAYANAILKFEDGSYVEAAELFDSTEGHLEAVDYMYKCIIQLVAEDKYEDAINVCEMNLDAVNARAAKLYALAMLNLNEQNYNEAYDYFSEYISYGSCAEIEKLENYIDPYEGQNRTKLLIAEENLMAGNLNEAKKAYSYFEDPARCDYSYNGIVASERIKLLDDNKEFVKICGMWTATYNYIQSKNVYKRDGSWDNWYIDEALSNQYIDLKCTPTSDGKMTIKGTVSFYRFTDYSSLKDYCQAEICTESFTISNVKSIPSSYAIDSDTTLVYSDGKFKIKHYVKDNYSSYFYNLYTSDVTYGYREYKY